MNPRQKAKKLIDLAFDEGTTEQERVSAMARALKIIRKYDLLASPLEGLLASDNETISAATNIIDRLTDPHFIGSVRKVASRISRARRRR
jgi:hypothetical protein